MNEENHIAESAECCSRCGLPLTAHPSECPWNPPGVIPPEVGDVGAGE